MPLYLKVLVPKRVSLQLPDKLSHGLFFFTNQMSLDSNTLTSDLKIMTAFFNVCEDQKNL